MNKKILFLATSILFLAASCCKAPVVAERWSAERANQWMADKGWIVGCDYVPSTAINQIEMWQAETFDPETIDRELGFAEGLGFNTVRIFFSNLVYTADPAGFKERFSQFLELCDKHGTGSGRCRPSGRTGENVSIRIWANNPMPYAGTTTRNG